ncbi:MSCRAMM family protein [Arcanobacterium phocae]|uniref:MSCRAMM family protein n=1 Tax=Arcanobacterium phocae TaxID=131112 RepID=UPI001C0E98BF|nr:SpaA isopeptide-forming pilin-related protein [Arcanobacterium phocae]
MVVPEMVKKKPWQYATAVGAVAVMAVSLLNPANSAFGEPSSRDGSEQTAQLHSESDQESEELRGVPEHSAVTDPGKTGPSEDVVDEQPARKTRLKDIPASSFSFRSAAPLAVAGLNTDDLANASTCTPGEMTSLGSQGEVRFIKNGEVTRTFDLPYGDFRWNGANKTPQQTYPADTIFDSSGQVIYTPVFESIHATRASFEALARSDSKVYIIGRDKLPQGFYDENLRIYEYDTASEQWSTNVNAQQTPITWGEATWQKERIYQNRGPQGKHFGKSPKISASFTQNTKKPNDAEVKKFFANITSGTVISDGSYIFGGQSIRLKPGDVQNGPATTYQKIFAKKTDGSIVYLGHVTTQQTSTTAMGDFISGKDGSLYVAYGSIRNNVNPSGQTGGTSISLVKVSAQKMHELLNDPIATWNRTQNKWVRPGTSTEVALNAQRKINLALTNLEKNIETSSIFQDVPVITNNFAPAANGFAGLDITPDNKVVVAMLGNESGPTEIVGGQTYTAWYQFDPSVPRPVAERVYDNQHYTESSIWQKGGGSSNKTVTDMDGCPAIVPEKQFKVVKNLTNSARYYDQDQFGFTATVAGQNPLQGMRTTEATRFPFETISVNKAPVGAQVTFTEQFENNADPNNYTTRLMCVDAQQNEYLNVEGTTGTVTLSSNISGLLTCTFTNTAKDKPKYEVKVVKTLQTDTTPVPGTNVTFELYDLVHNQSLGQKATAQDGIAIWHNVPRGLYEVREIAAPFGYRKAEKQRIRVEPDSAVNGIVTVNVVNKPEPGSLIIEKVDAKQQNNHLAGTEWKLQRRDNGRWVDFATFADATSQTATNKYLDRDQHSGFIKIDKLPTGEYRLSETRAPEGYILPVGDENLREFTVSDTSPSTTYKILNHKLVAPSLPLTGGIGRDIFTFLGIGVLGMAAAVMLTYGYRRHKNQ